MRSTRIGGVIPRLCLALLTATPVAAQLEPSLPEQPREDLARSQWMTLNGNWLFRMDPDDRGLELSWQSEFEIEEWQPIVVPFAWETRASGIGATHSGVAWYRRFFTIPPDWDHPRVFIVFGAVDRLATVWLNGAPIGVHEGGWTPFELDVTRQVSRDGENELVVRVVDETDPATPVGSQGEFTPWSGIWQTVSLENRPDAYLERFRVTADVVAGAVDLELHVRRFGSEVPGEVTVRLTDPPLAISTGTALAEGVNVVRSRLVIPGARPWRPGDPRLHDATIEVSADGAVDRVSTYLGLRSIATGDGGQLLLNGEPIRIAGVAHHLLHPEGGPTCPTDEELRRDVELALASGFNAIRVHGTVASPRFLSWCDRLGCLVIADLPGFSNVSPGTREAWEATARALIDRDFNHPSLISWTLFSDSRGLATGGYSRESQAWVRSMVELVRSLDPTRLVDDNSTLNRDHVDTDLDTWHVYLDDLRDLDRVRRQIALEVAESMPGSRFNFIGGATRGQQPLLNGSFGVSATGRGDQDVSFALLALSGLLRRHERIVGSIYRDLTDVEWLHRGIVNFDRSPKDFGLEAFSMSLAHLNGADFVGIDAPPIVTVTPGSEITLPIFVSHFSRREVPQGELVVDVALDATDGNGEALRVDAGTFPARWKDFGIEELEPVTVDLPPRRLAGAIVVTLRDRRAGAAIARNLVFVVARDAPAPRVEVMDGTTVALRLAPGEISFTSVVPLRDRRESLLRVPGAPLLEYVVEVPEFVPLEAVRGIELRAELAAVGTESRLDWPEVRRANDHPQTDERRSPTTLSVAIAGVRAADVELADAPSDLRGFVSYSSGYPNGIHGVLHRARVENPRLRDRRLVLRLTAEAGSSGIAIFGETMGRHVLDPTIRLELAAPVEAPADVGELAAARELFGASARALLPAADEGPVEWRWTVRQPPGDWTTREFDDAHWSTGAAPFGEEGAGEPLARTAWRGPSIWLRNRFDLESTDVDVIFLRIRHGGALVVALNGIDVLNDAAPTNGYEVVPLPSDALDLLVEGQNVVAVHCRVASDPAVVDVGVLADSLERAPATTR